MGDFESESCQGELLPVMLLTCWCCTCTREEKMVVPGSTQKTLKIGLYKMKIVCQPPFCRFHVTFWRVNECKWYKMHQNALKRTRPSSLTKKNTNIYQLYVDFYVKSNSLRVHKSGKCLNTASLRDKLLGNIPHSCIKSGTKNLCGY